MGIKSKLAMYLKVAIILGISLIVTSVANTIFFLDNSPTLRPDVGGYLAQQFSSYTNKKDKTLASKDSEKEKKATSLSDTAGIKEFNQTLKDFESLPFKKIAKGTYAKSSGDTKIVYYKMSEIPFVEYTYIVNGKPIQIRVPEGQNKPSQSAIDSLYK